MMKRKISVRYFQRRRRPNGNYSLEAIFEDVRQRLTEQINADVRIAPCYSNGVLRRIRIMLDAAFHQAEVNHVTGDNDFVAMALRGKRTVMTIHDCGYMYRTSGLRRWILKTMWLRLPVMRAAIVTSVSQATKNDIVKLTGCSYSKIRVVPNAISSEFEFRPFSFNAHMPRILHLGTKPNKNLPRLIEAIHGIRCKLVIIGPLTDDIKTQLASGNIDFESHVDLTAAEVRQAYKQCDLVTFVSTFEGFGMPIIEAQTVGRPVVTSNCSSMPEVAGPDACLVDPFDVASIRQGITKILEDAAYRQRLIETGLVNAKKYNADVIANQYLDIYRELVRA